MVETKQPVQTGITYAEWRQMPITRQPHEILDGELIMAPAPTSSHQWRLFHLAQALAQHVHTRSLGVVLIAPIDVVIRREPLRTRQPDLGLAVDGIFA